MQANSVLLFYGEKQQRAGKATTRILPVSQIKRPLVVLPDVHPVFSASATGCAILNLNKNKTRKHAFMVLRPRDLWHKVFLSEARRRYVEDGGTEGVARERNKNEREARKEAEVEDLKAKKKVSDKKQAKDASIAEAKAVASESTAVAKDKTGMDKSVSKTKRTAGR